jgi:hypothetical protein
VIIIKHDEIRPASSSIKHHQGTRLRSKNMGMRWRPRIIAGSIQASDRMLQASSGQLHYCDKLS